MFEHHEVDIVCRWINWVERKRSLGDLNATLDNHCLDGVQDNMIELFVEIELQLFRW